MKNLNQINIRTLPVLLVMASVMLLAGCNKELTSKAVQKDIEQARKATAKAEKKTQAAIESRRELYMKKKQARLDEMENRVDQIDNRLASLSGISKESPNRSAVADVNEAIKDFKYEKDSVSEKIQQFKSLESPDWDASIKGIHQAIDRIEDELNMLEKTLDNK